MPGGTHFHDLRHTGNHLAASTGASTRELMSRMGHSSVRAAMIYQHQTAERDRAIADAMSRPSGAPGRGQAGEIGHAEGTKPLRGTSGRRRNAV